MNLSNRKNVTRRFVQTNNAPPSEVFPLLCPVREADWIEGWRYELVHSNSGFAEDGCIFRTPAQHGDQHDTLWVVTRYEPEHYKIEFATFTAGSRIGQIKIALSEIGARSTKAEILYTFTSLSEQGDKFVDQFTEEVFAKKMKGWEKAINHYLDKGKMLRG